MTVVLAGILPGPTELWVILLVVILLFGATKIPDIARAMGRAKGEFKQGLKEGEDTADTDEDDDAATKPAR